MQTTALFTVFVGRAGNSRVYSEEQVAQIEAELASMTQKKGGRE
jgi:hypothetical protein